MTAPVQLPAGRRSAGGLTKDEVASIQRERLLQAMADAVAAKGYAQVAVADVIAGAGVSRATFYEQFTDKQDCFLAAFDLAVDRLFTTLAPLAPTGKDPAAFGPLLAAYLEVLAADVGMARVFLIDVYAAGPEAFSRRAASQHRFAEYIGLIYGVRSASGRFACEALVAAVGSLVSARLAAGDVAGLRALHAPIVRLANQLLV